MDEIEAGKCGECQLTVHKISENLSVARDYGVRVVPTIIIIDGEVKVEGRPDIPFACSDKTYVHLRDRYPLIVGLTEQSDHV